MKTKRLGLFGAISLSLLSFSCVSIPEGIQPVSGFELNRYLGTWYEIARLDHSFERGLEHITATYTLRDDGGINVLNKGYSVKDKEWDSATGRAYFVQKPDIGYLKVSFFRPFYGSYIVFELDKRDYNYALVCGPNRKYFWLLARTPQIPKETLERLIQVAKSKGFDTEKLIFVNHNLMSHESNPKQANELKTK